MTLRLSFEVAAIMHVATNLFHNLFIKVGIFALAEKEWLCSLACVDFDHVLYESYVETSRKIATELRTEDVSFASIKQD